MSEPNIEVEVSQTLRVQMTNAAWETLSENPMPARVAMVLEHAHAKSNLVNVVDSRIELWEVQELTNDGTMAEPIAWGEGDRDDTEDFDTPEDPPA